MQGVGAEGKEGRVKLTEYKIISTQGFETAMGLTSLVLS